MSKAPKKRLIQLLRRTEKYTKTDMVYLASGGFWLSLKVIGVGLLSLGLSFVFANYLPKETFGEYKYVFSIFALLAIPTLLGMGTSVTKSVAQGFDGTVLPALKEKIRYGFLGSIAGGALALYYFWQGNTTLAQAFTVVAIFLPFVDTLGIFNSLLTGKQLFKVSTMYEVIIQFFAISIVAGTVLVTDNLAFILLAYFASYTLIRVIVFWIVRAKYSENTNVDPKASRYGKHLTVMEMLDTVANTIDSILVWKFVGAAPLAVYAFAKAIPIQIRAALARISTLALPRFAQRDFEEIRATLNYRLFQMFAIILIVTIAYILAAPYIFSLLFPQYQEAVIYSQVFALTLLFLPKKIVGTILNAHAKTKELYIHSIIIPVTRIALLFILVPTYGILGAIISEIIIQFLSMLLLFVLFIRTNKNTSV